MCTHGDDAAAATMVVGYFSLFIRRLVFLPLSPWAAAYLYTHCLPQCCSMQFDSYESRPRACSVRCMMRGSQTPTSFLTGTPLQESRSFSSANLKLVYFFWMRCLWEYLPAVGRHAAGNIIPTCNPSEGRRVAPFFYYDPAAPVILIAGSAR